MLRLLRKDGELNACYSCKTPSLCERLAWKGSTGDDGGFVGGVEGWG